jgi:hypothetical protein
MFNREKTKDIVDEMTLAEFVEMNVLRKRVYLLEFKYDRLYPLDIKQYEFDNTSFATGGLRSVDDVISKLNEIKDLYDGQ